MAALLLAVIPAAAAAQSTTYNVSGTFNFGTGTYAGTVTYDGSEVSAANITTSAGNVWGAAGNAAFPGGSAISGATYSTILGTVGNNSTTVTLLAGPAGLNQRLFSFSFNPALGTVSPDATEGSERVCETADCGSQATLRSAVGTAANDVVGPPPAPVPTLSEWAMILFGATLAAGAALLIQRRRQFA